MNRRKMIVSQVSEKLLGKTSKQVYNWITNMDQEKYLKWHPDHTTYQIKNSSNGEYLGSVVKYEQIVDDKSFWWKVISCTENQILYRASFIYPIYLELSLEDFSDHVLVTQKIMLGLEFPGISQVIDWLVRKVLFTYDTEEKLTEHTKQEFKNLERMLT